MDVAATSSSSLSSKKYEVFLSFRGEDTRRSFTSHLYKDLCRKGIDTFIDTELQKGNGISPALIQAIEDSSLSVIVFSKNYASSKWCLDELTHILRCKKQQSQHVVPIFYEVDPSDVRHQRGAYEEAFAQHLKKNPDKVAEWREALLETASLTGWDSCKCRDDVELIENIVSDIKKLRSSKKDEVFLSFMGEDTRRSFTSHLHTALCLKGIKTSKGYEVAKGDDISQSVIQAIEDSSLSVIVFSKNYASSKWCLNELIEILRCKQEKGQLVVPIYYQVEPSDVRRQKGPYEQAFAQHLKKNPEKVAEWRKALSETTCLAGWWDSYIYRDEAELIQNIVSDIKKKLNLHNKNYC